MPRVERSGWNLMGRTSTSSWYVIDITRPDPLSLGELGGGDFLCFGSSVLVDMLGQWKLVGVSETCTNWLNNSCFPDLTNWGLEGEEKKWDIFNLRMGDWILVKFDVQKDFVSQSSYYKSRLYPVILGGVGGGAGNLGKHLKWQDEAWREE